MISYFFALYDDFIHSCGPSFVQYICYQFLCVIQLCDPSFCCLTNRDVQTTRILDGIAFIVILKSINETNEGEGACALREVKKNGGFRVCAARKCRILMAVRINDRGCNFKRGIVRSRTLPWWSQPLRKVFGCVPICYSQNLLAISVVKTM